MNSENPWTFRNVFRSRFFTVGMFGLLVVFTFGVSREALRRYEIHKEIQKLEASAQDLEQQNSELSELMDYLTTSSFTEREARVKLGYQKPGEKAVVIPVTESDGTGVSVLGAADTAKPDTRSNPHKWFDYFFN